MIAIGNSLRRDDGAGRRVIELLAPPPEVAVREVFQLTPEIAEDLAGAGTVIFVDASVATDRVMLEPVEAGGGSMPISHSLAPAEVVALAQVLYGFTGRSWLCHVPGVDFEDGEGLSETAEANARRAAERLRAVLWG
ncbi:MAG: hydrogenase maturation protease [Acidobacteria bacterium]|nr:hydrogenase maturation protease [Acidobacteriota bacterium]